MNQVNTCYTTVMKITEKQYCGLTVLKTTHTKLNNNK